jgi:hypothetical protein
MVLTHINLDGRDALVMFHCRSAVFSSIWEKFPPKKLKKMDRKGVTLSHIGGEEMNKNEEDRVESLACEETQECSP